MAFQGCPSLASVTFDGTIAPTGFYHSLNVDPAFLGDLIEKYLTGGIEHIPQPHR
jgi:hypothetical protein